MTPDNADWEVEEVETTRPAGAVISVRVSREMAGRLFAEAERRNVPTSAVVRDAVEAYLSNDWGIPATLDVTVSVRDASATLYPGRSRVSRSEGAQTSLDLVAS